MKWFHIFLFKKKYIEEKLRMIILNRLIWYYEITKIVVAIATNLLYLTIKKYQLHY